MENLLKNIASSFNIVTGIELGIGDHTERLYESLGSLTTLCRNSEMYHKYKPPEFGDLWILQHYSDGSDINTFFDYFKPEYDLAVISYRNFQDCLTFFAQVCTIRVPYIISLWDMKHRHGYTSRVFGDIDSQVYFYYRDITETWIG